MASSTHSYYFDENGIDIMMQRNIRGELTVTRSEHLDELDIIPRLAKFLCVTSSAETRLLRNAMFPPLVCHAAHANDVKLLEILRLSGANVTSVDYDCRTALHVAAAAGSLEAVTYLLKHGVSVHSRDSGDENAMMCAVRSKNLKVVKAILQAGGQMVATSQRIGVEMCLAAGASDIQALKAWSEAKVDLSTADYDGRTALHVASAKGLEEVVRFLCANGASPQAKDYFGRTPLDECSNSMAALGAEKDHSTEISVLDNKLQNISGILRNSLAK